ncbi:hypothetical protein I553_5684 [Mycobacterium xenopi 4042]|uniref:Uncharacterized protein n=1 Tax=Mycobacterium xenopi 4042 TaxID=1299334 RepID=X7ZWJ7_MYCXE|nr:hypothetical protein I553_5684 [Mycobacterium xenopi 4042]
MLLKPFGGIVGLGGKRCPVGGEELANLTLECQRFLVEVKVHLYQLSQ